MRAGAWWVGKLVFANFRKNLQKRGKVMRGYMGVSEGEWWVALANIAKICKNLQKVKKEWREHAHPRHRVRVEVRWVG